MRLPSLAPVVVAAVLSTAAARPAAAEGMITGSVGRAFSGDLEQDALSYGAAIGYMGGGVLGFEVEGTYTRNPFLEGAAGSNNVTTLMGNVLLGVPLGEAARIYATAGAGLMKFDVPDVDQFFDVNSTDFGMNAGAGVMVNLGDRLAARGDVTYFRDLRNEDSVVDVNFGTFHYWRGAIGLTLRF
jgi:opacity protein-like surface antigen